LELGGKRLAWGVVPIFPPSHHLPIGAPVLARCLSPLLAAAVATSGLAAADQDVRYHLGFDFGFTFNLYNDDRLEGASTSFALVFPIKDRLYASVYHERGNIHGDEDGFTTDIDVAIYQVRVGYAIWANASQELSLFIGLGHGSYTGDIDDGIFIGDIGVKFAPFAGERGPIKGQLDVRANYRYARIDDVDAGLDEDIDDLGGFQIGLGVGIYF